MGQAAALDDLLTLENKAVALSLAPAFGARVTSLIDKRTGRDWLAQGALVGRTDNDAPFMGEEARGWDECYPTVGPCPSSHWGRRLRDHGDLWARRWDATQSASSITATYNDDQTRFRRTLTLEGASVGVAYEVTNTWKTALPTLWSQHCLLACEPGERLELEGISNIISDCQPIDLSNVNGMDYTTLHDIRAGVALKAYGCVQDQAQVGIIGENGGIAFSWSAADAAHLGLWFDYGGWPDKEAPVHQVAIEPTTSPTDDLEGALAGGHAIWLKPGQSRTWNTTITLSPRP